MCSTLFFCTLEVGNQATNRCNSLAAWAPAAGFSLTVMAAVYGLPRAEPGLPDVHGHPAGEQPEAVRQASDVDEAHLEAAALDVSEVGAQFVARV